jgi:predicted permease
MAMLNKLRLRLRALFLKSKMEEELDDEVRFHLERETQENIARGMSPEEARFASLRSFGGVDLVKEESRDERGIRLVEEVWQDLRYAFRMFRRHIWFTVIAILAIGIGIGSSTAIFSVVQAVLLDSLPVANLDRLMMIWQQDLKTNRDRITFAPAEYVDYLNRNRSFSSIGAAEAINLNMTTGNIPEAIASSRFTHSLFQTLGIKPVLGRVFVEGEELPGQNHVALLSYRAWITRFNADNQIVGKVVQVRQGGTSSTLTGNQTLDGAYTIIGVLPPDLAIPYTDADLVLPLYLDYRNLGRTQGGLRVFGLLKPGVTIDQATSDLNIIARDLEAQFPARSRGVSAWLVPLHVEDAGDIQPTLLTLLAAVGLLLLIVCANVANMLLVRAVERQKEISLRCALGVERRRLIRQLLTESLLLGLMGAIVGLVFAFWATRLLASTGPASIPRIQNTGINFTVLGVTLVTGVLTSILFGLVPAIKASRSNLADALRQRTENIGGSNRIRNVLVVAEVALAFVVLTCAALVSKSFIQLQKVNLGYNPQHLLTSRISLPDGKYDTPEKRAAFFRQLLDNVRNLPGVSAASAVNIIPQMGVNRTVTFSIEGRADEQGGRMTVAFRIATPDYFRSMVIPILQGREFNDVDLNNGAVIISRSLARQFWPQGNPLGESVRLTLVDQQTPPLPIVGVADDFRQWNVTSGIPTLYWANLTQSSYALAIRTVGDPDSQISALQRAVLDLDPGQPIFHTMSMEERLASSQGTTFGQFRTIIATGFGMAALFLAILGIYSIIHHSVLQRTQEIGIRMALGALRKNVILMVLRQGILLVTIGIGIGLVASLMLTRLLATFVFLPGVTGNEPVILIAIAALLAFTTLVATFIPARRAARIDPMVALRFE